MQVHDMSLLSWRCGVVLCPYFMHKHGFAAENPNRRAARTHTSARVDYESSQLMGIQDGVIWSKT